MAETVGRLYSLPADDPAIVDLVLETPPKRVMGDIAVPIAFALARRLRKAPRAIAQELAAALGSIDGITRVEAAPNGYLNLFLDRPYWLKRWLDFRLKPEATDSERARGFRLQAEGTANKTIVEHTAINPNKAAHIGHLRNATTGDAFGRLLRFQGRDVEIQNYIDDTGVQVADVVVGFRELEHKTLDDVRALAGPASTITAGTSTPKSPSGTRGTRTASRFAAPRSTPSSTAATTPRPWPRSSPTGSCAATCGRWHVSTSGMTS